jgi:peptide-methionine (S)-S-oxide reductase
MPSLPVMPVLAFAVSAALVGAAMLSAVGRGPVAAPAPRVALPASAAGSERIVLAGGGFWGVQAVFQHMKGVESAVAGYAGDATAKPNYEEVSAGRTDYAEAVEVTFDPRQIGLGDVLRVYFSAAHNPTEVDKQGPDEGRQYRSEIFAANPAQANFARGYIAELDAAKTFGAPVATKVATGARFYPAEDYHQDYAARHPDEPYVAYNDAPKVASLKRLFPAFYRATPTLVAAQ